MKQILFACICLIIFNNFTLGQEDKEDTLKWNIELGIRAKKFAGFYWENGLTGEISHPNLMNNQLKDK